MADGDVVNYRNVKALVRAFDELDGLVIKACREAFTGRKITVPITENELSTLESLQYWNSANDMYAMLQHLERTTAHKQTWQSAMLSILKQCSHARETGKDIPVWKFRLTQLIKAGDRAWRLVVPCAKIIVGGADTINEITAKFAALDDALYHVCPSLDLDIPELRYSDELQDTLHALIAISRAYGISSYVPPPTAEQIEVAKSEIRRRRNVQVIATVLNEKPINEPPPPASLQSDTAPRNWNPTIMAFAVTFTALSSLPGLKAIQYSKHSPGTVEDDNFWFLVQGSMMQILGLLTIILPLLLTARLYGQPWFWTWGFVAASAFSSGAAIPLYLYVPTEWSAIVAWLSSAFQAFVILQGMFITGQPLRDVDKDK